MKRVEEIKKAIQDLENELIYPKWDFEIHFEEVYCDGRLFCCENEFYVTATNKTNTKNWIRFFIIDGEVNLYDDNGSKNSNKVIQGLTKVVKDWVKQNSEEEKTDVGHHTIENGRLKGLFLKEVSVRNVGDMAVTVVLSKGEQKSIKIDAENC